MRQNDQKDNRAVELIRRVTDEVENIRPTPEQMFNDIKMMKFKVRSISGNIFDLGNQQFGFLESLWRVAKTEEIITGAIDGLDYKEREVVFRFLDNLEMSAQEKISAMIDKLPHEDQQKAKILRVEIFREPRIKKTDLN